MGKHSILALCAIVLSFPACAYQFQGRSNPLQKLGVHKIYVRQFDNKTYRPGVEQMFSSAMVKEIQKFRSFELVGSPEAADAVLTGEVTNVASDRSSNRQVRLGAIKDVDIASEFTATVLCSIQLMDKQSRIIFSQVVSGSKIYPGSVRTGDEGATVPLVNDSEQRLAVQFVASQMMASVYQRMIDTF